MFGRGKQPKQKSAKKSKDQAESIDPKIEAQIHVMPQRFYVAQPKQRSSSLIILLVIGLLLIGGLGVAGFFLLRSPAPAVVEQTNSNSQPVSNTNLNQNTNTDQLPSGTDSIDVNSNSSAPTSTPTSTPEVNIPDTNTNTNTNVNPSVLPRGPDTDADGLTTAEETLYGTDPDNQDSDSDNYADGSELLSGYDPRQPQRTLQASGLFTTSVQSDYSVSYPSSWQPQSLGSDGSEVIFQAPSGEFFEVIVISNPNRLSLQTWYDEQFPNQSASVIPVTIGTLEGLRSTDSLNYYFIDRSGTNSIYFITYNTSSRNQIDFLLTFSLVVKSFTLQ